MIVKANCKLTEKRLASIKDEIIAVQLWNHMSADELGKVMGLSARYLYGAMATLRARGEIEQASHLFGDKCTMVKLMSNIHNIGFARPRGGATVVCLVH